MNLICSNLKRRKLIGPEPSKSSSVKIRRSALSAAIAATSSAVLETLDVKNGFYLAAHATAFAADAVYDSEFANDPDDTTGSSDAAVSTVLNVAMALGREPLWDSITFDCRKLARSGNEVLNWPLWVGAKFAKAELNSDDIYQSIPLDMGDTEDELSSISKLLGPSALLINDWYESWADGYKGVFDEHRSLDLALKPNKFWKITIDRTAEEIMNECAEVLGWSGSGKTSNRNYDEIIALENPVGALPLETSNGQINIGNSGVQTDVEAAKTDSVEALHRKLLDRLETLSASAARLDNQVGWEGLQKTCDELSKMISEGTIPAANRIVEVWAEIVELGTYIDQDDAAKEAETSFTEPLDPAVRRQLDSAIMMAVPYARSHPTAVRFDTDIALFANKPELIAKAIILITSAKETGLLNEGDAEFLLRLLEAGKRGESQSNKATSVAVQTTKGVVQKAGACVGIYLSASLGAASPEMAILRPGMEFMRASDRMIMELIEDLPSSTQHAFRLLLDEIKDAPSGTIPPAPKISRRKDGEN